MCPEIGDVMTKPQVPDASDELADLHNVASRLRDLASYLANHELEHEAAYVMMAFKRVCARLTHVALQRSPGINVAA